MTRPIHSRYSFLLGLFLFFNFYHGQSQTPRDFNLNFKIPALISPSAIDTSQRFSVDALGNFLDAGVLNNFSYKYFAIDYTNKLQAYKIGIQVFSQSEGDFLSKNKIFLVFAKGINLHNRGNLMLGMSLGGANYSFSPSKASGGGSAWALDGNLGISYQSKKINTHLGIYQFLNRSIKPISYTFQLAPLYFWHFQYLKDLFPDLSIALNSIVITDHWLPAITIAPEFKFKHIFSIGVGYTVKKGYLFYLGSDGIKLADFRTKIFLSYFQFSDNYSFNSIYSPKEVYLNAGY